MMDVTIAIPVILGVVAALKTAGLKSRYAPITAIGIGLVSFYFFGTYDVTTNLFMGLISALSASGLYSGAKATVGV